MSPGSPIAAIVLAAVVGVAGAVVVVAFDSVVADVIGVLALFCGLAVTIWSALRLASAPDASA